ncbi:hypothetical protein [Shewanella aestuarii]|uniref:Uncharacterized protein n=1 Tax=Shewanella aestuarii TaxID=1028752 RepID=A0A6G9QIW3_9GAMM|nr:hypothetical protein [Shewanella aestuarii]QIR13819.1 hypothetical protein HBH39_04300 [Shewanella aestuarii]
MNSEHSEFHVVNTVINFLGRVEYRATLLNIIRTCRWSHHAEEIDEYRGL